MLALLVNGDHQVGPVIQGDLRLMIQRRAYVPIVGFLIFALDGVDRDAESHQGSGHIVLCAQRVGCAKSDVGSPVFQRQRQVGRLAGDVETPCDSYPFQRLLPGESLPDRPNHRHLTRCPVDAQLAFPGQRSIFDIMVNNLIHMVPSLPHILDSI
ncbi:MAG: hypothetical protein DDT29_00949 [Dehalococcoidia bacterium]|nr:hypothetical protein [Bacillota bacterium]